MGFRSKKEKINGKAFIMIALLVFLVSGAWGSCRLRSSVRFGEYYNSISCPATTIGNCEYYGGGSCTGSSNYGCPGGASMEITVTFNGGCPSQGYVASCESCFGQNGVFTCNNVIVCSNACESDSTKCVNDGNLWTTIPDGTCNGKGCLEHCDSTYHCESVFTENNVVRSNITLTDCRGSVLEERQVLGSCIENGFCEGDEVSGSDSCSYPAPDPLKCRFGGQNGSLCTYVCPDGKLHSCRIAWTPGQPSEYQNCPKTPPTDCVAPLSSSSSVPDDSIPDYPTFSSSSSSPVEPDPDCPECEYLEQIRDTLHRANEQRRYANYVLDEIKDDIGVFGIQFSNIASNTSVTSSRLNIANSSLSSIASTNSQIANKLNSLDLDNITASVDSVVVHVDVSGDSAQMPWKFYDLDSLPVWRDTVSRIGEILQDIHSQVDTLYKDSTGRDVLTAYLPGIKRIADTLENFYAGYTLPKFLDSLESRLGLDTLTISEGDDMERRITLSDTSYIEGNWYCEQHPDDELCIELDSAELRALLPPDTVKADSFFAWHDSLKAAIDSALADTTQDTIGLDELAGDSAKIREKLGFLFFPNETLEQCFEFRMNSTLNGWAVNLLIDFSNVFGWDLCDLIRKIVRLITFILIVFTTIKGYIRAFGGGGPGGG